MADPAEGHCICIRDGVGVNEIRVKFSPQPTEAALDIISAALGRSEWVDEDA